MKLNFIIVLLVSVFGSWSLDLNFADYTYEDPDAESTASEPPSSTTEPYYPPSKVTGLDPLASVKNLLAKHKVIDWFIGNFRLLILSYHINTCLYKIVV
jgi:hypothetical protein